MGPDRNYQVYRTLNQSRSSQPVSRQPKQRPGYLKFAVIIFIMGVLFFGGKFVVSSKATARDKALEIAAAQKKAQNKQVFSQTVNKLLNQSPGLTFSISAVDLANGEKQSFGSQKAMDAASTGKLITAIVFFKQVEQGDHRLSETLAGFKAEYLLRQLINKSDDQAWEIMNDELGHDALKKFMVTQGLNSYNPDTNTITANDMASLLQRLYSGRLLNHADTEKLKSYMIHTNYENLITPALPVGVNIYHKVGLSEDYVNDAAIINQGNRSFVLVIYSDGHGSYNWDQRAFIMQKITSSALPAYL